MKIIETTTKDNLIFKGLLFAYNDPRSKQLEVLLNPLVLEKTSEYNIELLSYKVFDRL